MPKKFRKCSLNNNKRFRCKYCKNTYSQKGTLNRHIKNKHSNFKGKACKYCGKEAIRFKDHEKRCELKFLKTKIFFTNLTQNDDSDKNTQNINISDDDIYHRKEKYPLDNLEQNFSFNRIIISKEKSDKIDIIGDFKIYKKTLIAEGGTMKIFYGTTMNNDKELAIKIPKKKKSLKCEFLILKYLNDIEDIPKVYFFCHQKKNILVEDLFGPSLRTIFHYQMENFDLFTICDIGIQIISILKKMHDNNIVHNDIKPSNICWGKMEKGNLINKDKVYLIDFGYSRIIKPGGKAKNKTNPFNNKYDNINIFAKINRYEGTPKYMSIKKGDGYQPTKQSDLEELLYSLIFLFRGNLPWGNLDIDDHVEKCIEINKSKSKTSINELCKGLPEEFTVLAYYILNLDGKNNPCYNTIINLFKLAKEKITNGNIKEQKFSFRKNINEKFNKYIHKIIYDNSDEEIKLLFGSIPINKYSLLD